MNSNLKPANISDLQCHRSVSTHYNSGSLLSPCWTVPAVQSADRSATHTHQHQRDHTHGLPGAASVQIVTEEASIKPCDSAPARCQAVASHRTKQLANRSTDALYRAAAATVLGPLLPYLGGCDSAAGELLRAGWGIGAPYSGSCLMVGERSGHCGGWMGLSTLHRLALRVSCRPRKLAESNYRSSLVDRWCV